MDSNDTYPGSTMSYNTHALQSTVSSDYSLVYCQTRIACKMEQSIMIKLQETAVVLFGNTMKVLNINNNNSLKTNYSKEKQRSILIGCNKSWHDICIQHSWACLDYKNQENLYYPKIDEIRSVCNAATWQEDQSSKTTVLCAKIPNKYGSEKGEHPWLHMDWGSSVTEHGLFITDSSAPIQQRSEEVCRVGLELAPSEELAPSRDLVRLFPSWSRRLWEEGLESWRSPRRIPPRPLRITWLVVDGWRAVRVEAPWTYVVWSATRLRLIPDRIVDAHLGVSLVVQRRRTGRSVVRLGTAMLSAFLDENGGARLSELCVRYHSGQGDLRIRSRLG